jgi:hypothetical protein
MSELDLVKTEIAGVKGEIATEKARLKEEGKNDDRPPDRAYLIALTNLLTALQEAKNKWIGSSSGNILSSSVNSHHLLPHPAVRSSSWRHSRRCFREDE